MSIFRKKHIQSYDKMNKKPVLKTSICTGDYVRCTPIDYSFHDDKFWSYTGRQALEL
jgi:hypothetical protein